MSLFISFNKSSFNQSISSYKRFIYYFFSIVSFLLIFSFLSALHRTLPQTILGGQRKFFSGAAAKDYVISRTRDRLPIVVDAERIRF